MENENLQLSEGQRSPTSCWIEVHLGESLAISGFSTAAASRWT
jgi:hypothetical protein